MKFNLKTSSVLTVIYSRLHFYSPLLVKAYKRDALRKELIITPFIEWFQTSTLRMSY